MMDNGWQHWSAAEWVTLIGAVTAAIASIVNAIRGKNIEEKVDRHEQNSEARAEQTRTELRR